MAKFADLGDVQQIEVEGRWTRQPLLGAFDASRQMICEYLWPEINLSFFYAEERTLLSATGAAVVWQMFSATRTVQDHNRELMPSELKKLKELMRERSNSSEFSLISARLRLVSGRLALQVVGRHTALRSEHNCLLVPKRRPQGWTVQELAFRFPSDWYARSTVVRHSGYTKVISDAWQTIVWNNNMPPLYVPARGKITAIEMQAH